MLGPFRILVFWGFGCRVLGLSFWALSLGGLGVRPW